MLTSLPVLYLLAKQINKERQLLRASLICSSLAYLIGLKDDTGVNLGAAIALSIMLSPELTPFATALALMFNLDQFRAANHN